MNIEDEKMRAEVADGLPQPHARHANTAKLLEVSSFTYPAIELLGARTASRSWLRGLLDS